MTQRTGRCLCGDVSFTLAAEPLLTRICWCRACQHLAANGTVNMLVAAEALEFSGTLSEFTRIADSGNTITHQFCPKCGTQLFALSSGRPQFRVVRVGNLDEPSSVQPSTNIWACNAPDWAHLNPELERVDHQPQPPKPVNRSVT
jgi:hypothetical protein